jgi:hypothetical protein
LNTGSKKTSSGQIEIAVNTYFSILNPSKDLAWAKETENIPISTGSPVILHLPNYDSERE